jgi:hypothetical protein
MQRVPRSIVPPFHRPGINSDGRSDFRSQLSREALRGVRGRLEYGTLFDPTPLVVQIGAGQSAFEAAAIRRVSPERQFFRMMQSPPAAFNPLHNFAAFSADAKGPTSAR